MNWFRPVKKPVDLLQTLERFANSRASGLNSFQITIDGSRDQHDRIRYISEERGSYDIIMKNIRLVAKSKLFANVRINISEDTLTGINELLADFNEIDGEDRMYINFDMHKVWQVEKNIEAEINNVRFLFRDADFNSKIADAGSVINSCYGDKRYQATLNYNGEVFKCTARDFKQNTGEGQLLADGTIEWNERYEKRMNIKFNNPPCRECNILPLCGGGCSQHALENANREYCIFNFDEQQKMQIVKNIFRELVLG
jgi:uncharacterized protein